MVADVTKLEEIDDDDDLKEGTQRRSSTKNSQHGTRVVKAVKTPKKENTSVGFWIKC